jgi:hypothetical protein
MDFHLFSVLIQLYVINFVIGLLKKRWLLWILQFLSPIRLTTTMPNEKKRKPQTEQFPNLMEKPASIGKMGIPSQGRIYGK